MWFAILGSFRKIFPLLLVALLNWLEAVFVLSPPHFFVTVCAKVGGVSPRAFVLLVTGVPVRLTGLDLHLGWCEPHSRLLALPGKFVDTKRYPQHHDARVSYA